MIYIAYTTGKKEKRWFDFPIEIPGLEYALNKSSRARRVRDSHSYRDPSLGELVGGGVDIAFVVTTPEEEAFVKIIPYEKTIDYIVRIYIEWLQEKTNNSSIYQIVKENLIAGKYKNALDMFDDIREAYKKSAVSMVSFYSTMQGKNNHHLDCSDVPQKVLCDNLEHIETAIRNERGFKVIETNCIGNDGCIGRSDIVAAEYHVDIANRSPLLRVDIYFNKNFTQQEIDAFKAENFENTLGVNVIALLPDEEMEVLIISESGLTEDEVNKKYFGI